MSTLLIILGVLVGSLAGYKFGQGQGLKKSFVIIDHVDLDQVRDEVDRTKAEYPNKELDVLFDRHGFEVLVVRRNNK